MRSIKPPLVLLFSSAFIGIVACDGSAPANPAWRPGDASMWSQGTLLDAGPAPTASDAGGTAEAPQEPVGPASDGGTVSNVGPEVSSDAAMDAGGAPELSDAGAQASEAGTPEAAADAGPGDDRDVAAGLHELVVHDACTGANASQPDTCLHEQRVETQVTLGGDPGSVYDVRLRVRGLFEPTNIRGGESPLPEHPYFKVGGSVAAGDYSQWHIAVASPMQTYWLNHYPTTSHTIYSEDFEVTIPMAGGSQVTVGAVDANDREINNGQEGPPDRRQLIDGVTPEVVDGQILRLDVLSVQVSE